LGKQNPKELSENYKGVKMAEDGEDLTWIAKGQT